jgi:toxin ParE1/3/4
MNGNVQRRAQARQDLVDHFAYIGQQNEDAANRFLQAAEQTIAQLAQFPGMGAARDFGNPRLAGMRCDRFAVSGSI